MAKRKGRSAAFMRSINPHFKKHHAHKRGRTIMAKRHRSSRKSSFGSGVWGTVIGVGGFIAYESFISPMIPLSEPSKSIAELAVGAMLMNRSGIIGKVAKTAVVINVYQLMALYLKPMLLGSTPNNF